MNVIEADLWEELSSNKYKAVLIPTNGCVNREGFAVMGAGVARDCRERFPETAKNLGTFLKRNMQIDDPQWKEPWNVPYKIGTTPGGTHILSFPTKPTWVRPGGRNDHIMGKFHKEIGTRAKLFGWMAKSDLLLIERSANLISIICDNFDAILLPTVGTGHGELKTKDVKPLLEKYFDDRYTVVIRPE